MKDYRIRIEDRQAERLAQLMRKKTRSQFIGTLIDAEYWRSDTEKVDEARAEYQRETGRTPESS